MSTLFSHFLSKNNQISPLEADFTEVLGTIALVPKMLYFYGKMPENMANDGAAQASSGALKTARVSNGDDSGAAQKQRPKTIAIVGTRKPTAYGRKVAYDLAYAAAKRGAVVVSGLAYGIDSIAHRGALDAGGVTVAVLGTPINQIYPRAHQGLAEEIVQKGGCVMSELPPDAPYYAKTCFLERNRLISGLADVVVIPEAARRSGSLNTAAHALEQGREVFAAPGDITRPMSEGCNQLIAKSGAMIYTGVDDVLELIFPAPRRRRKLAQTALVGDTDEETAILGAIYGGMGAGEEILAKLGMPVEVFNRTITLLEIKGRVAAMGCNRWAIR